MNQKKWGGLLALLIFSTLTLSACAAPQPPAAETPAAPQSGVSGMKMAAVLSGPVNDAGWNTNAYQALTEARDKYGLEIAYTEYVKVEDAAQVMRDYADAGFQIIMAHGNEYSDQISEPANIPIFTSSRPTAPRPAFPICTPSVSRLAKAAT